MPQTIDLSQSEYSRGQNLGEFQPSLFEEPEFRTDPVHHREDSPSSTETALVTRLPFGPIRSINPRGLDTTWQLIEQLSAGLPLNEYDLPIYVYRADMLDVSFIGSKLREHLSKDPTTNILVGPDQTRSAGIQDVQAQLDAAVIPLSYAEGFPVLPTGALFWNQLDYESNDAYAAFVSYLELGGARQISKLVSYDLEEMRDYFHVYYWAYRVKAFDLYKVAHHQKVKLQRMLNAEDNHFNTAEKMLKKVQVWLENVTLDDDNVTPEKAVNILEKLVKIQRISVGLPANGESKENTSPRSETPVNVIMQQITQSGGGSQQRKGDDVDLLMEDPDSVDLAQELIIRMQTNANGESKK